MSGATVRSLPTTAVALFAALALAVAAVLLVTVGLSATDSAGASWNKKSNQAGASWNKTTLAGASWNRVQQNGASWN